MLDLLYQIIQEEANIWIPKVLTVIGIFAFFYVLSKIIKKIILKSTTKLDFNNNLGSLLARVSSISIIIFGLITAFGTLGINISALVAGLGLTGFALGFALKDIISNLLSGVLILLYHPFEVGNKIKITGLEGTVTKIDLRYTSLESNGDRLLIPNSNLFTHPIIVLKKTD